MSGEGVRQGSSKHRAFGPARATQAAALTGRVVDHPPGRTIYTQGDPGDSVLYIVHGCVRLSVVSAAGKEVVLGVCGTGEFFGEGALAGRALRYATATTMVPTRIRAVSADVMRRVLRRDPALNHRFLAYLLLRKRRLEEALLDQFFNDSEKRLAKVLLLLVRHGAPVAHQREWRAVPTISQRVLAEMVGTTRSRVNFFMNKFRTLGFIEYDRGILKIHQEHLSGTLRDNVPTVHRPPRIRA